MEIRDKGKEDGSCFPRLSEGTKKRLWKMDVLCEKEVLRCVEVGLKKTGYAQGGLRGNEMGKEGKAV